MLAEAWAISCWLLQKSSNIVRQGRPFFQLSRNSTCNLQHRNGLKIHCRGLFTVLAQVKASLLKKQQAPAGAHESSPAGTAG